MDIDFDSAVPGLALPASVDAALREAVRQRALPPEDDEDIAAYVQVTGALTWAPAAAG